MKPSELKQLIREEIHKINLSHDYQELDIVGKNLFESYWLMGELLDPTNSYPYEELTKGYWVFEDDGGYEFFVRMLFQPVGEGYWEIKMGWVDLPKQQKYLQQSAREIDERRSDTIAKIYKDEILPRFISQNYHNTLKIIPLDIKRYQFTKRLINKYPHPDIKIVENKPKEIILTK